ncbi:MAG: stage III sporulation AC/AD family protein [Clostridiales bacterium]|nr:stage III sporulation AC/AD family protein [Clostridiales bacterium]
MTEIVGISIAALLLSVFIKEYNKAAAICLLIAAGAVIFLKCASELGEIGSAVLSFSSAADGTAAYIKLMLKVLGISITVQFAADLCRDAGESALAYQCETAAKIIILAMILPLFETVIKIIAGLVT